MVLAMIDENSHRQAMLNDSLKVMENMLFPMSFPWGHSHKAPVLKRLPADIDECAHILYADSLADENICDGLGILGFGRYETGDHRKGRAKSDVNDEGLLDCSYEKTVCAARRAEDPGQIELAVMMPPPPAHVDVITLLSLQRAITIPAAEVSGRESDTARKIMALVEAERAEAASYMPFSWERKDRISHFNPPAFIVEDNDTEKHKDNSIIEDEFGNIVEKSQVRPKSKRAALTAGCIRKWKVRIVS